MAVSPHLYKLRFKPTEDLAPITTLVEIPLSSSPAPMRPSAICKASSARPARRRRDLGQRRHRHQAHLTQMLFQNAAGIDLNVIAYKGGAPAVNDLMGGHLDSMIDNAAAQAGYIQAGKVRGLFVTSKYRVAAYPTCPRPRRPACPDSRLWAGSACRAARHARRGHPAAERRAGGGAGRTRSAQALTDAGWVPVVGTPEEARERARADLDALGKVVRQVGLQPN